MFDKLITAQLLIQGMSCGHCQQHVNKALHDVKGVKSASVELTPGRATVTFAPKKSDLDALSAAVGQAGYTVTGIKMVD